jgi:hypothetical protein
MRDLRDPYERANACVACHQNVSPEILAAGHPELIFELDGQSASQPRHWQERYSHSQLWLVGQAAALREMSYQLSNITNDQPRLTLRTSSLAWLLQAAGKIQEPTNLKSIPNQTFYVELQSTADKLARVSSKTDVTNSPVGLLGKLSDVAPEFRNSALPAEAHARRAERLVLALDRITLDLPSTNRNELNSHLDRLFKLSQNIPEFAPVEFAAELEAFHKKVPPR